MQSIGNAWRNSFSGSSSSSGPLAQTPPRENAAADVGKSGMTRVGPRWMFDVNVRPSHQEYVRRRSSVTGGSVSGDDSIHDDPMVQQQHLQWHQQRPV